MASPPGLAWNDDRGSDFVAGRARGAVADIRLSPPWSYLVVLVPLAVIAIVIGVTVRWDWRAFIVPALFIVALIPYLLRRNQGDGPGP